MVFYIIGIDQGSVADLGGVGSDLTIKKKPDPYQTVKNPGSDSNKNPDPTVKKKQPDPKPNLQKQTDFDPIPRKPGSETGP